MIFENPGFGPNVKECAKVGVFQRLDGRIYGIMQWIEIKILLGFYQKQSLFGHGQTSFSNCFKMVFYHE